MARSLNKVILIGNTTREPEVRYTAQNTALATFSLATNRQWKDGSGQMQDEAEFHRIVAWGQLAEICEKLLGKGDKVYVEGRLQTRDWESKEGEKRQTTEIVITEMILLESRSGKGKSGDGSADDFDVPADFDEPKKSEKKAAAKPVPAEDDDIPF